MGKKRRNKKKQSKPQVSPPQCLLSRQDVLDELLALEAVYGEDITISREEGWFSLIVTPNPSDPESSFVFVTLNVQYTENYPDHCPELEFRASAGISESQSAELLEELNQAAIELSKLKDVFLFTLIDHCQESLRQWNEAIHEEHLAEFDAALRSIKHQDPSFAFSLLQQGNTAHGLFGEPVPISPRLKPKTRQHRQETHRVKTQDLSLQLSIKDRTPILTKQQVSRDLDDSRYGTGVSTSMLSLVASMMEKIGPLPTAISTYLGLAQTETEEQIETSVFRTEMLIGHLLRLLTSGKTGSFQKEMLPFLCTELHEKGILPKWLHWILIHKPTVFEKIFNKIFTKEIEVARNAETNNSQSVQLLEFWTSPIEGTSAKDRVSTSRYHTDFEEVRIFGKGGFGIVVSAINRLDGRQYAIKKIKLVATSINAYTKIIREVSTLARLQHPNVVRYFQAWLEPSSELDELQSEDSMNLDALLQSNTDSEDADLASKETGTFSLQQINLKHNQNTLPVLEEGSLSSQGTEFVSMSSEAPVQTPQIVFESGSGPRSQDLPSKGGSKAKEVRHQILYIQMEACPRTLQQILASRTALPEEEKWEILRQILRGLAYIHSQRTIHRDLKPANIFYSSTGEIKLGDFGLAKFATNESMKDGVEGTMPSTPSRHVHSIETSGVCGTSFYIAPEIENHWPGYDSQVDMYSLGIVVFEIWHPFSTLMERILTLKELKEKGQFPLDWKQRNPKIAQLVSWLLAPIPSRRPTAKELLRSEFLPARVGDEQVQDLIRSFENDSETYDRVIEGVFRSAQASSRSDGDPVLAGAPLVHSRTQLEFQDQLLGSIKEVLGRHGVGQMTSQDTGLCYSSLPSDAVRVLSSSGELHSLKYDMRYPFVEWILQEYEKTESGGWSSSRTSEFSIENLRRFDVDWICREGQGSKLVRKHLQLDVDFVTAMLPSITESILNDSVMLHKLLSEQLLSEAELIKIVSEIANCFRFSDQECTIEIRLTHSSLLLHCLEDIGLDKSILPQALNLLSMTGRFSPVGCTRVENWTPVQTALEGLGLSSSQLRNLKRFMTRFSGESELIVPQLRSALSNGGNKTISPATILALEEIQNLVQLLQKWSLFGEQVVIDPIMIPESDYYSGIYFQVHLIHPQKRTGKLLAIGGRYEKLMKSLWKSRSRTIGSSPNYGLIGTTMNLTPFIKQKLESIGQSLSWRSSSDVLVCSKGGGASNLETRMELISSLWSQGIKAEMLHRVNPTMTAQYDYATVAGMRILVIIDDQILSSCKTVKIKNLDRKQEDDVPYHEVPQFILNILQTRTSMTKLS